MLPDQENQKNLLLAIVLSVAVLLAWQFFYAGPKLKEEQDRQARIRQEQRQDQRAGAARRTQGGAPTPRRASRARCQAPASATTAASARQRWSASPRVRIETPSVKGSIALKGGRIDDVVLAKYRETVDPKSPNVVLFSPSGLAASLLCRVRLDCRAPACPSRCRTRTRCGAPSRADR